MFSARAGAIQNSDPWAPTDAFFLGSRHYLFPVEGSFQFRNISDSLIVCVLRSRLTMVDNGRRENVTVLEHDRS